MFSTAAATVSRQSSIAIIHSDLPMQDGNIGNQGAASAVTS
jgi:hypothetical protein